MRYFIQSNVIQALKDKKIIVNRHNLSSATSKLFKHFPNQKVRAKDTRELVLRSDQMNGIYVAHLVTLEVFVHVMTEIGGTLDNAIASLFDGVHKEIEKKDLPELGLRPGSIEK